MSEPQTRKRPGSGGGVPPVRPASGEPGTGEVEDYGNYSAPGDLFSPSPPVISSGGWAGDVDGGIVRAGFTNTGERIVEEKEAIPFAPYSPDDPDILHDVFGIDW